VHPIDKNSPLFGLSHADLKRDQIEIFVSLTGIDDTFSQTIHSRFSYTPEEILWDKYFVDILAREGNRQIIIDLEKIHDVQ
jgi:inward rectifier potassium channel